MDTATEKMLLDEINNCMDSYITSVHGTHAERCKLSQLPANSWGKYLYSQDQVNRHLELYIEFYAAKLILLDALINCQTNRNDQVQEIVTRINSIDVHFAEHQNISKTKSEMIIQIISKIRDEIPEPKSFLFFASHGSELKKTLKEVQLKVHCTGFESIQHIANEIVCYYRNEYATSTSNNESIDQPASQDASNTTW